MLVLVTIHGIGFEQAPTSLTSQDGYADDLHAGLQRHLGSLLSDDPNRASAGGSGPVYVQSSYPPHTNANEAGLSRLGKWVGEGVDATGQALASPGAALAHVALVYSGIEEQTADTPALLGTAVLAAASPNDYATLGGLVRMAFQDLAALRRHPDSGDRSIHSLTPRTDAPGHRGIIARLLHSAPKDATSSAPAGPLGVLRNVEDDVAAYVTRNEHRERVRAFLRDAVSRIIARGDVVILNGHSNGTVMALDLAASLSPPSARKIAALVTCGSPLRKFVDLLDWGRDVGNLRLKTGPWVNFWDPLDPVADPLALPAGWERGQPPPPAPADTLFVQHDPDNGTQSQVAIEDITVDNVSDSAGGGLRAHNYWDNDTVCKRIADVLRESLPS